MKVMLVVDYFPPFTPGGSEWSIHYLSKAFSKEGVENIVVTPNYGAKEKEVLDGVVVFRFPNLKNVSEKMQVINPVWQNNPLFFIWSAYYIYQIAKRNKVEIIHVNGKFTIPGSYFAACFLKVPIVISIRDKHLLCSYGKCFFERGRYKACGWTEYLTKELFWFYRQYVPQNNIQSFIYTLLSAIWTRLANNCISFFAKKANKIVSISESQKKYLEKNGFQNVKVIYNSFIFPQNIKLAAKRQNILFAGKLSLGKGAFDLLKAIPMVNKKFKEKFIFAGNIEAKTQINQLIKLLNIEQSTVLLGGVNHLKLQNLYQQVKVVVMPSIYPEAFGRVALEALAWNTPVVVSDTGGLPEIVINKKTGIITEVTPEKLAAAICSILKNENRYLNNIFKMKSTLRKRFETEPIEQHIKLYKKLLQ